jgi:pimeloyl-ACP methyl ester carboxylesterase
VAPTHDLAVAGSHVEVEELGAGEPVVVVQTALSVHEHAPLSRALSTDFHVWHVHRPGYGGSGPVRGPASITADADLVASVLDDLDVGPAHLVGASYSAAVVLTLASRHDRAARSVAVVEPPPYDTPAAAGFRAACRSILDVRSRAGAGAALDEVMTMVDGPDWRAHAERDLPGSVADMERDAATFFDADLPALLRWTFDDEQAATIACPTLLVGGAESHERFHEMLTRLERVLARTTRVTVAGAGHSAALTHPAEVATAVRRHVRAVSRGTREDGAARDRS